MPANIHDLVRLPDGRAGYVRIVPGVERYYEEAMTEMEDSL